jgi:ATP:corrinoid adenosyltransferase
MRLSRRHRIAASVVRQVSEADVRNSVVLVFKATGNGTTTVAFGLTRGETSKAYESRRFLVRVR